MIYCLEYFTVSYQVHSTELILLCSAQKSFILSAKKKNIYYVHTVTAKADFCQFLCGTIFRIISYLSIHTGIFDPFGT